MAVHFEKIRIYAWELTPGDWIFLDDLANPVLIEKVEHGEGVRVSLAGSPSTTYSKYELVEVVG